MRFGSAFESRTVLYLVLLLAALWMQGCGKSSDSDMDGDGVPEPYGMETRPTLAPLNIPLTPASSGDPALVTAFPGLPAFTSPVYLTHSGDGTNRLFVVEQHGVIKVFNNTPDVSSASVFLDITDRVVDGGELGLLGLAFDPDYESNGYFYVYYTAASPLRSVLSRFRVSTGNANQANVASETVLMQVDQPYENHNGGTITFGPDGMLYWGLGDGGSAGDPQNNGQNNLSLLGKMLRINVRGVPTYTVPADNPFVGNASYRPEIWALGLRNPYRFSFDRENGRLWLADVGQYEIEEIDVIEKGKNYGWNWYEGTRQYRDGAPSASLFEFPVFEYDHNDGVSITGGYVYRGSQVLALQGKYVYADFASSHVWVLTVDDNLNVQSNTLLATSEQNVSAFGEDEAGELYVVGYGGTIYAVRAESSSDPLAGFPAQLSDTGLFSDTTSLTPASGLIEYSVQAPLWSDHAEKTRWIALPNSTRISFDANGNWQFPVGTVLVKHFGMEMTAGDPTTTRRLETRVLVRQTGSWVGVTYRWNAQETDATLQASSATETLVVNDSTAPGGVRTQEYFYPGSSECLLCHTPVAGRVLGVRTRQLNHSFAYSGVTDNQLRAWNHIGLFTTNIGRFDSYASHRALDDTSATLEARARSYLEANCAFCHTAGGTAPSALNFSSTVALAAMNAVDVVPSSGSLGIVNARIIAPGDHERSVLWHRMVLTDENRMPRLGSNVEDSAATAVIAEWIDSLL
ncbi:MAG: PQQ-dependent sugar dehydrogenase [Pseudomonadota bacterium]